MSSKVFGASYKQQILTRQTWTIALICSFKLCSMSYSSKYSQQWAQELDTLCFPNVKWCLQLVVYFRWVVGEWGECSVSCGDGVQKREIVCRQEITPTLTMTVAEGACLTPPSTLSRSRTCQRRPCSGPDTQWSVGAWSQVLCTRNKMFTATNTNPLNFGFWQTHQMNVCSDVTHSLDDF